MGKNIEQVITRILSSNPDGVVILNQLSEERDERYFVVIDNKQTSCTEQDLFYINTYEISKLENFLDIDGFYKIDIEFTDGRELVLEYLEPVKMQADYDKLFYWFKKRNSEGEYDDTDIEDSDSEYDSDFDSDSDFDYDSDNVDEETTVTVLYTLAGVSHGSWIPSFDYAYTSCGYWLYLNTHEIILEQGDEDIFSGEVVLDKELMEVEDGKEYVYVNIYHKLVQDPDDSRYDIYVFPQFPVNSITFHYTQAEADNTNETGYQKTTVRVYINGRKQMPF